MASDLRFHLVPAFGRMTGELQHRAQPEVNYIDVPNLAGGSGCGSLVNSGNPIRYFKSQCFTVPNPITVHGNLGSNTLIGPGFLNFDFSVFKNNYIKRVSNTFNLQFRTEFFNVLNRANFAAC